MSEYVIYTDSSCDIDPKLLAEWNVKRISLTFHFKDNEKEYTNDELPVDEFYQRMRDGEVAVTSAPASGLFADAFKKELTNGLDILYIAFSSGLSNTFNSARLAADELREQYPERSIVIIDSLSASAGFGMLVYLAAARKKEGASLEENAAFIRETIPHQCHWFTVDDLVYLKRGGRISSTVALVGGVLRVKPLLHMDDEGHLIKIDTARGRKQSIRAMADKYGELAIEPGAGPVFISHGDCLADAEYLAKILKERYGAEVSLITYVGSVIGAHSGPGTLALFFLGKQR